ncbi:MAG: fumarate hydratase, partial [Oscillospiraceae bacterium]
MKEIQADKIISAVSELCINANMFLPCDVKNSIETAKEQEPWPAAKEILGKICENIQIAQKTQVPLCQDTGMACIFLELGQDVHIVGMGLYDAINEGVRQGYAKGYLRKSVVGDPINRVNTKDNTPALINTEIVDGESLKITVAPKGFGSENM